MESGIPGHEEAYASYDANFDHARDLCSRESSIRWLAAGWLLSKPMDPERLDQILGDVWAVNHRKKLEISKKSAQKRALEAIGNRALHMVVRPAESTEIVPDLATAQLAADRLAQGGPIWRRESGKLAQKIDIEITESVSRI